MYVKPVLIRVYFSRHYGGTWVRNQRTLVRHDGGGARMACDDVDGGLDEHGGLEFEEGTDRLVVYSALHSHASYNRAGRWNRFWRICPDYCDRGHRWLSRRIIVLNDEVAQNAPDRRWMLRYRGNLGDGHVIGMPVPDWWSKEEQDKNYGQGLVCVEC